MLCILESGLIAPETYRDASPELRSKVCNGCGSSKARFDYVPDAYYGLTVTPACWIHDWMYHEGICKILADVVFLANQVILAAQGSRWLIIPRIHMAVRYFLAVFFCGESSFGRDA